MNPDQLTRFETPESLAETAAREWLQDLSTRASRDTPYAVALSGGRITRTFFEAVVHLAASAHCDFEQVHFFWADDRCVGPDDDDSNFKLADALLFQPLNIAPEKIHRIRGELEPDRAAKQSSKDLENFFASRPEDQRRFDMIFLGMGEDGHTASLFPGESEEVMSDPAPYRAVVATKPPPNRITLGYGVIKDANEVVALISGSGKADVLKESLSDKPTTPMGRVIKSREGIRILTDIQF